MARYTSDVTGVIVRFFVAFFKEDSKSVSSAGTGGITNM